MELLKKYLQGRTSPDEEKLIKDLLVKSEEDDRIRKLLEDEWRLTSTDNELGIDIRDAWKEFKLQAGISCQEKKLDEGFFRKLPARFSAALVAASILAVLLSAAVLVAVFQQNARNIAAKEEVTYTIKKTGRGEKLNISLPDGSFIKLNSSTQLRIPSDYNVAKERIVYLEGEAFFEVAKFDNKPFKVISDGVTTEVLGTSFNVNTFSSEKKISVAVISGSVRVANDNNEIILHPEEMTTVGATTTVFSKINFDVDFVTGWRNNLLIFDKVTFEEIIEGLTQWYGVEFIIENKPKKSGTYSGRFENKSLQLVLEGLGFSSAFEYKIVDKTVYLNFK